MVTKLTLPSKENAVQEKVNEIIDNLGGGYSAGTGIDISNNTISVDNTVAMKTDIPAPVTETTVSDWGFTKNAGTVTSVNNVSPVNGNVTLSIPAAQVNSDWNAVSGVAQILNKPTLGTMASESASDYTPTSGLATVATSGAYSDLTGTPTIPTVNNATLTITQGGTAKGTFTANASSDVTIALDAGGGGSSRNIGEIVASTIPLTDAGLHLLDGALINGSGSYADFVTYIAGLVSGYPDIFTTEANWQSSVSTYGACDKYVYDNVNNTVRIPKRNTEHGNLLKSYLSGTDWYRIYEDGWCEQGGYFTGSAIINNSVALLKNYVDTSYNILLQVYGANYDYTPAVHDKTTSSFRYGARENYTNISWQACGYIDVSNYQYSPIYEYIVIANSTKTQIEVDIDEIATDLNGKVDKADLSTVHVVVETYVNGTSWYRVYDDGWCEQGGYVAMNTGTSGTITFLKTFANTNYNVVSNTANDAANNFFIIDTRNKTVSSAPWYKSSTVLGGDWFACGRIS